MADDKLLKTIFLFFFSLSNTSSSFFIIPILYENLIQINDNPKWYIIGNIYSIHEFGKFFGNFFWIYLKKYSSSSVLILISLFFLSIFNLSFIFINSYNTLIIYRFLLGFSNNLTVMTENIFLELSLKKEFGLILYIIKTLSTIISIIVPINILQLNSKNKNHKFILPSITLSLINLFSILLTIIMIRLKYLKFFLGERIIQLNVLYNESENNTMKSGKKFSMDISNPNEKEKIEKSSHKKKEGLSISNEEESYPNSYERHVTTKIKNTDNNTNINEKNNIKEVVESGNIYQNIKQQNQSKNSNFPYSSENFNHFEGVQFSNKNNNKYSNNNKELSYKELKFTFIYILLNVNDTILFIWIIMFLYNKFNSNSLNVSFYFVLYNVLFSSLNYPLTRRLMKKQYSIEIISNKMIFHLILLIVLTFSDGIGIYVYVISKRNYEIIIVIFLFILALIRNLINSLIIQMFQIYISKKFNVQSESIRKLQKLKQYLTSLFKTIIIIFSSISYFFFSLKSKNQNFKNSLLLIIYFILIPEIILNFLIILIKQYL
jgi:hypothetical protein